MVKTKRGGLGKGLDSLITEDTEITRSIQQIKIEADKQAGAECILKIREIEPNRNQPRKQFEEDSLQELADSIKIYGVIQPLIVQKKADHYEIIAGERRWRAAKMANLKEVPVIVKNFTEQEVAEISLIENLQREDLNPIEEAHAYQRLLKEFNLKQDEVANRVSKSRTVITNSLRLLKLDDKLQKMLMEGLITTGHAKVLLGVDDKEVQLQIAEKIIDEQLSVRETEQYIRSLNKVKPKKKSLGNVELYQVIEDKLKNKIGTKVKINRKGENKGKIEIEYYSSDDLERIMEIIIE
ncbi:MAG: ParB/RepB/Spo0J family partition protein [Lachnospiraceae bacterium]